MLVEVVPAEQLVPCEEQQLRTGSVVEAEVGTREGELELTPHFELVVALTVDLVDHNVRDHRLVLELPLADSHTDLGVVLVHGDVEHLSSGAAGRSHELLAAGELLLVVDTDASSLCHDVTVKPSDIGSEGALMILVVDGHLEVVVKFASIYLKARLINLKTNSIPNPRSKHHL